MIIDRILKSLFLNILILTQMFAQSSGLGIFEQVSSAQWFGAWWGAES